VALALAALLLGVAAPAGATSTFPARIVAELDLRAEPACSLCHEGATARGTVTTPFGTSLRERGLLAYDEQSLVNALMALEGEGTDSDGDGVGDIEELRQGADPNLVEGGEALIVPEYGCSAGPRGGRGPGAGSSAGAVLALAALARRLASNSARHGRPAVRPRGSASSRRTRA